MHVILIDTCRIKPYGVKDCKNEFLGRDLFSFEFLIKIAPKVFR